MWGLVLVLVRMGLSVSDAGVAVADFAFPVGDRTVSGVFCRSVFDVVDTASFFAVVARNTGCVLWFVGGGVGVSIAFQFSFAALSVQGLFVCF